VARTGRSAGRGAATGAESAVRASSAAAALAVAGDPFEALGDPNRRAIVELLASGSGEGRSVGELARELPISRPAVSRHLRLLKRAGLVVEEPRGTRRIYRLHDAGPEAVRAYLEQVWGDAAARFRLVAENTAKSRRTAR
jgi:DNA-binding transcriptional ArsR family regulator